MRGQGNVVSLGQTDASGIEKFFQDQGKKMSSAFRKLWAILVAAVPLTVVCVQAASATGAPQEQFGSSVGVVLHDKEAYLTQQFIPQAISRKVVDAISTAGAGRSNFKRLTIETKDVWDKPGAAVPTAVESSDLYIDAGRGFVSRMEVLKVNGFEISTSFELTYRGLLTLRTQSIAANATKMPTFTRISDFSEINGTFGSDRWSYALTQSVEAPGGPTAQFRNECKAGASYPASQLTANIQGSAHDVDCQLMNANGIVSGTVHYSYLETYGVAILLQSKSLNGELSRTVTGFKAE